MLINDTSTIATEVPVYLAKNDLEFFLRMGFSLPELKTPVTGHVDIIQIRNNFIHVLDYKPEAGKEKPISQLTLYSLALSSRLKIPLKKIKAAWFDEKNYYEFYPLKAVYKKRWWQKFKRSV